MKAISFVKGLGWAVFLNILIKPLWIFGIDRQLQNEVGHEAYGAYFALLNLSIIFSFLTDAGISNLANVTLASGTALNRKSLLQLKLRLSVVYVAVVFIIAAISGVNNWEVLLLVVLIQVLTSMYVFLRSIITANQLFATDAFLSVLDKVLMLVILGPLLYLPFSSSISIRIFLWIQLGCTAISVGFAALLVVQKKLLSADYKVEKSTAPLRAALPFAIIILLMATLNRLDGFLLGMLRSDGAYQAGIYASAYRLLDAGNMVGYLFASFLVPFIARHLPNRSLVEKMILGTRHILLVSGGAAALFVCFFSTAVQQLLYHFSNGYTTRVLQLCISVLPAYLLVHVYGSLLTAAMELKAFIMVLMISVLLNGLLNVFLIPHYGAAGSAAAALISQYLCAFSIAIIATKKYGIGFQASSFFYYFLILGGFALLFFGINYFALQPLVSLAFIIVLLCLLLFAYIPFVKRTFPLLR